MDQGNGSEFERAFGAAEAASYRPPAPAPFPNASGAPERNDRLPSRDEVRRMRLQDRQGVPFDCKWTGIAATVRRVPLADKTFLVGLPSHVEVEVKDAYAKLQQRSGASVRTLDDALRNAAGDERLANAVCVAGFIRPRLVLREEDLDPNDPECYLVTDIDIEDRREYMAMVLGRASDETLKRVLSFRTEALANG